jgi:hypothetical protein
MVMGPAGPELRMTVLAKASSKLLYYFFQNLLYNISTPSLLFLPQPQFKKDGGEIFPIQKPLVYHDITSF